MSALNALKVKLKTGMSPSVSVPSMPTVGRAYATLEVKSFDDDERIIEGIASTPNPDRMDDVVESMGAEFKLPLPLLWKHQSGAPVGHVTFAKVTKEGIPFKARLAKVNEPGTLKDELDRAWQMVKAKLVRAVSIGFRALEVEPIFKGKNEFVGFRFKRWEWLELSLVVIPANADATIQTIRSIDIADMQAATGTPHEGSNPGVTGRPKPIVKIKEARMAKKSISEQLAGYEATRASLVARMTEIMEESGEEGETLDAALQEEYDNLGDQIKSVDGHINRLRQLEAISKSMAQPVAGDTQRAGSESRAPAPGPVAGAAGSGAGVVQMRHALQVTTARGLPAGTAFTRYAMALAASNGNLMQAAEIAKRWHNDTPEVEEVLKSAVAAGTTTDAGWALPLVPYQQMASEFIELLRPLTILGRLPGLRRVPFNITMPSQTAGSSAQWVGEAQSKPVSSLTFTTVNMRFTKVANIVVLTEELVRFSNPAAEAIVRGDMAASMAQFLDQQFTDPTVTAVANVSPASITNGAPTSAASGTAAANLRADLKTVIASFASANIPFSGVVMVMGSNTAASIALMTNALGQAEFPTVNQDGGTLMGIAIIVSDNVPTGDIIFVKPSEILLADDGNVTISVSREASLQLDSAPSEPPASMVSLWQQNMVGLRAERFINWQRRRTQAVYVITAVDYGTVASV